MSKHRKEGKLNSLKSEGLPTNLLFFDTETNVINYSDKSIDFPFKLGYVIHTRLDKFGSIYRRRFFEAYSIESLNNFILSCLLKRETLYIFAHNIGFDLRVCGLVDYFDEQGFESEPPIINNMVFLWTLTRDKYKIIFVDTANLGVRTVSGLGKDLGLSKLEIDFDKATNDELMTYCIRDTEILEKFVLSYLSFIRENRLGAFRLTLASQALAAYRTSFIGDPIMLHNHYGATILERESYYGGRTEAFRLGYLGQQEYFYLDVNSMYPHAMVNFDLPSTLKGYEEKMNLADFKYIMSHYYVIADVTIETKRNIYPLRVTKNPKTYNYLKNPNNTPYPILSSNRLIFPIGRFRTTIHHEELREAIKDSSIVKIHRVSWYSKTNPFNDYIEFFYGAKNRYGIEGNKTYRTIAKLFLNSLYGKFGQLEPYREYIGLSNEGMYHRETGYNEDLEVFTQEVTWQGKTWLEYKKGETSFSNPAIAGAITANARISLYNFIELAGKNNVFYVDTDSLMTNKEGYENLLPYLDDEKIGYLKLERKGRRLIIRGNKDYRLDGIKRFKGLPSNAKKIEPNLWEMVHFEGFITWLNEGARNMMQGSKNTKSRQSEYNKGIVGLDGIIKPYILEEK